MEAGASTSLDAVIIKQDRTPDGGYFVSTIWRSSVGLMIDRAISDMMALFNVTPEEIGRKADLATPGDYETMVFRAEDWDSSGPRYLPECDFARYETEEDALVGHQKMVEKWSVKLE